MGFEIWGFGINLGFGIGSSKTNHPSCPAACCPVRYFPVVRRFPLPPRALLPVALLPRSLLPRALLPNPHSPPVLLGVLAQVPRVERPCESVELALAYDLCLPCLLPALPACLASYPRLISVWECSQKFAFACFRVGSTTARQLGTQLEPIGA